MCQHVDLFHIIVDFLDGISFLGVCCDLEFEFEFVLGVFQPH